MFPDDVEIAALSYFISAALKAPHVKKHPKKHFDKSFIVVPVFRIKFQAFGLSNHEITKQPYWMGMIINRAAGVIHSGVQRAKICPGTAMLIGKKDDRSAQS
ncbi:MAG: hypothetical protein M0Z52_08980 [Actinomycetota bacterium]|nr:hypothetical protein [Actinomycetota bacterium]